MLSDVDIVEKVKEGKIVLIDPQERSIIIPPTGQEAEAGQLEAHGYDLRANKVYSWKRGEWVDLNGEPYTLRRGEFIVVETYERMRLANDVGATVHSMARMSLLGYSAISTTIHPGWCSGEGEKPTEINIGLANIGRGRLTIEHKMPFCRLLFHSVETPSLRRAPRPESVFKRFEETRRQMSRSVSKKRYYSGWAYWFGGLALAITAIVMVKDTSPLALGAVGTISAAALSVLFAFLRERYNIV